MDLADILVWVVVTSCLGFFVWGWWMDRENMRGWLWVCGPLLVITLTGFFAGWRGWLEGAAGIDAGPGPGAAWPGGGGAGHPAASRECADGQWTGGRVAALPH